MASTKRRALTIAITLAGLALATVFGVQVYRSKRYLLYALGVELDLASAVKPIHWEFDGKHLRPLAGKFRGWYLSTYLDGVPTQAADTGLAVTTYKFALPGFVLTDRPFGSSEWKIVEKDDGVSLVAAQGRYEGWAVADIQYEDLGLEGGPTTRWSLVLTQRGGSTWQQIRTDRGRVFRIQRFSQTLHLGTVEGAAIQTRDLWDESQSQQAPVRLQTPLQTKRGRSSHTVGRLRGEG
ncbi:MAG: hypothetical protein AAF517_03575 [Planctomycetota bacterium]